MDLRGKNISHYHIQDRIGQGGMGVVYKAQDLRLNRLVALKFLPEGSISQDGFRQLQDEARAISSLNHKNIATIYDFDTADGLQFIVLEYLPGGTLKQRIRENGVLSPDEATTIAIQIAEGLAYAHVKGTTHRDIKTENIMFADDGTAKLTDFGLSKIKAQSGMTKTEMISGTLAYMSPEQIQGSAIDLRTDIWSFGVVLYEMLVGHPPFEGSLQPSVIYGVLAKEPVPVSHCRNDVPSSLQLIVSRCLEKDPEKRFRRAEEILEILRSRRVELLPQPAARSIYKFWWLAVLAGIILLAYLFYPLKTGDQEVPSLAILYLKNLGRETDEPLTYGITQDLIVDLARAGWIRVAPMTDILQYRDANLGLDKIADKLNVRFILEGSILRQEELFKISAQLVDVKSQRTLWAERYELNSKETSKLQSSMALSILQALKVHPTPETEKELKTQRSENPEAFEFYLKAKYKFDTKQTKEDVAVAQGLYQHAIELDSEMTAARLGLGEVYRLTGDYERAQRIFAEALPVIRRRGEHLAEASCLRGLGLLEMNLGEYDQALHFFHDGLSISRELGDRFGEARFLNNIGLIAQNRGDQSEALRYFQNSLEIRQELGDLQGQAQAFGNIGLSHFNRFEYAQAIDYNARAMKIDHQTGDKQHEALLLNNTGLVQEYRGNYQEALQTLLQSLQIEQQLGDPRGEAQTLNNIGLVYQDLGVYPLALRYYERAESIHVALNNRKDYAICLDNIGQIYSELGELAKAFVYHTRSVQISREIGSQESEAYETQSLGINYLRGNNLARARENFEQARALFTRIRDTLDEMTSASYLALVHAKSKSDSTAKSILAHIEELIPFHNQFHEPVALFWNLAQAFRLLGEEESSHRTLQSAWEIVTMRANSVADVKLRESYLSRVRVNREVVNEWSRKKIAIR